MRKLFLLIPFLAFALISRAADQYPEPTVSNSLYSAVLAVGDGETIWLDDAAPYDNVKDRDGEGHGDDYTKLRNGKNITIRAIAGKHPVIKYEVPFLVREAANAKFIGVKFDGTSLTEYDYYFLFYDAADNSLEFEDCEFTGISKYCISVSSGSNAASIVLKNCSLHDNTNRGILNQGTVGEINISGGKIYNFTAYPAIHNYGSGTIGNLKIDGTEFYGNAKYIINGEKNSHADSCIVTNCYFHDNARSAIFFAASETEGVETCDGVIVKNSTFANHNMTASDGSVIEVRNYNKAVAANIEVTVDHCTFYNNTTSASGYATGIRSYKSTKVNISNCIFAHPEAYARCGTYCYGGNVTNCLSYNLTSGDNGHNWDATRTNCFSAAPQFTDAANADYSFSNNNWVTPSLSPACGAATDGLDLGDPRWHTTAATLPSVDFASAYDLVGTKAQLTGNIRLNSSNHIEYYNNSVCGIATWRIHTTKACAIQATIDMENGSASGSIFQLIAFDNKGKEVGRMTNSYRSNDVDTLMPGTIYFPAAGDYTIRLNNNQSWSSAKVEKIILAYAGGNVQSIPATLNVSDAWYGDGGIRADGNITFSSWKTENSWIKWNIATTEDIFCTVKTTVTTTNGHNMTVAIYEDEDAEPIATLSEGGQKEATGDQFDINLGRVYLAGGKNYVVKVTNPISGSAVKVDGVKFEQVAIPTIELPNPLLPADAMLSERAWVDNDSLLFTARGDEGYNSSQWAKWKIHTDIHGYYKFTLNAYTAAPAKAQQYILTVLSNDESQEIAKVTSTWNNTENEHTAYLFAELAPGNYIVKVQNPEWGSKGRVMSIVPSYEGGAFTELPGQLLGNEAMLHATKLTRDASNNIQYNDNGTPTNEYVMWNIHVTDAAEMVVTLNVATAGHIFSMELYKDGVFVDDIEESESTKWDEGDIELTNHLTFSDAGNYQLKLINNQANSIGALHGITFAEYVAPAPIVIDENATENGNWATHSSDETIDLSIIRTFKGGMYNTICLPFELGSQGSMEHAFGVGYELLKLNGATLSEGGVLDLTFDNVITLEYGVPYLIKPVADVVNPSFTGRKIKTTTVPNYTRGVVDFVGTFTVNQIPASENNLFLGPDNTLYFPTGNTAIKGMRAWFRVNVPGASLVVKHARIVAQGQVVTSIDLVDDAPHEGTLKVLENGQLFIIKNGVRYNLMGAKIQ